MKLAEIFEQVAPNQTQSTDVGNAADDSLQAKMGTYAALKPNQQTVDAIVHFMQDIKLTNQVTPEKLHVTVIQSDKFLPNFHAQGSLQQPFIGINLSTDIWQTGADNNALVLVFSSPQLEAYHQKLMDEHGATYPYDTYIPHMTLSYDMEDSQYNTDVLSYELGRYLDHLELDQEYEEPLKVGDEDADDEEAGEATQTVIQPSQIVPQK